MIHVSDGAPAVAARVSLRPRLFLPVPGETDAGQTQPVLDVATDSLGRFTLGGLPPGDYSIVARDQESLACLMQVRVDAGKRSMTLPADTLRPTARISGEVAWQPGFPYHKVFVAINGMERWTVVDSSGRYALNGLPAGELTVRFLSNLPAYFRSGASKIGLRPSQDRALEPVELAAVQLGSRDYWVDTAGSDSGGDGSAAHPWRTLAFAARRVPPDRNHTLAVGAGTFQENQSVRLPTGVNLTGRGRDQTVIASDQYQMVLVRVSDSTPVPGNQVLSGFKIDGMSKQLKIGIEVKGRHNVVIRDVEVSGTREQGVRIVNNDLGTAPGAYLQGIEVHSSRFRNCAMESPSVGTATGCLQLGGLEAAYIHDLDIAEDAGRGINTAGAGYFKGLRIRNCTIRTPDSSSHPLSAFSIALQNLYDDCAIFDNDLDNPVSLTGGDRGRGLRSVGVHGNRIVADGSDPMPSGAVIGVSDAELSGNYIAHARVGVLAGVRPFSDLLIHHNVFFDSMGSTGGAGLRILLDGHSVGGVGVISNVFHNSVPGAARALGIEIQGQGRLDGLRVLNNIFMAADDLGGDEALTAPADAVLQAPEVSHNLLSNMTEGSASASFIGSLHAPPGIVGSGAKPFPYYRPAADTSNLVDSGIPTGLPFRGVNPDIGAYEQ